MTAENQIAQPADHSNIHQLDQSMSTLDLAAAFTSSPRESLSIISAANTTDAASACLPNCSVGFWAGLGADLSSAANTVTQSASELGSSIKDTAQEGVNYAEAHPLQALGYTAGALVGGVVAVVCSPVELSAAAAVGAAAAGAAAIDGSVYLLENNVGL